MLLHHFRKPVLAAALALLVLPGATLATDDNASPHAKAEGIAAISNDLCLYFEMNILGFDCSLPLAEYAGQPDPTDSSEQTGLPAKPDGVDWRFWEENVWELQGDDEASKPAPPPAANRPGDRPGFF